MVQEENIANVELVFGFVCKTVIQNSAAWADVKEFGNEEDAEAFFQENVDKYPHLDWFCYEVEEQ